MQNGSPDSLLWDYCYKRTVLPTLDLADIDLADELSSDGVSTKLGCVLSKTLGATLTWNRVGLA